MIFVVSPAIEHNTIFEAVPEKSSQIISVGLSHDLNSFDEINIKDAFKKVYTKDRDVYKTLFKSFSNNTFIFREQFSLEIDGNNAADAIVISEKKRNITTENMNKFFEIINRDKLDVKFAIFYGLMENLMPKIEDALEKGEFKNIVDRDGKYKVFLKDKDIFLLSNFNWINTGSFVMDFIYAFHKEFSKEFNPHLTQSKIQKFNNFNMESLLLNADNSLTIYTTNRVDLPLKAKTNAIKANLFVPYLLSIPAIVIIFIFSIMNSFTVGAVSSVLMLASMIGTIYVLTTRS